MHCYGQTQRRLAAAPESVPAPARRSPLPRFAALLAVAVVAGSLCMPLASAQMYRYVDESGVTVYSQSPPPEGNSVRIDAAAGPGDAEATAARERLRGQLESELDRRLEEQQSAEASARAENATARAQACEAARGNLETLQSSQATRLKLPDGTTIRPTDEQRAGLIAETRAQIGELCE